MGRLMNLHVISIDKTEYLHIGKVLYSAIKSVYG